MNDNTINVKGPTLADNGYLVCPIKPGKKACLEQNWQSLRMTAEDCEYWPNHQDGVGILCGVGDYPICGVDMDIAGDEEFSAHMKRYLEETIAYAPVRYGKFPKFLALFRAEEAGWGKTSTNSFQKDGNKVQLEVLGKGNQFVAYHTHPDTGKPYLWENDLIVGSPEFSDAEDLPVITRDQITDLMQEFTRKARELGYEEAVGTAVTSLSVADTDLANALTPPKPPMPGISISKAKQILKDLNLDLTEYDPWLQVGMALHHQFDGSDEALALWEELSSQFPTYQEGACERKWDDRNFRSDKPNAKTFRTYFREWEKTHCPDYNRTDELGLLHRFLSAYGEHIAYFPNSGKLCAYDENSGHWTIASARAAVLAYFRPFAGQEAREAVATLGEDDPWTKALVATARKIGANEAAAEGKVIQLVKDTLSLHRQRSEFDSNPRFFAVANGVVDLPTATLLPNAPELRALRRTNIAFDPEAKCPTWEKAIYECMGDDAEMVKFLQRLFGSALTGNPVEDKVALLRGLGCNGKSVFTNTMRRVFGGYAEIVGEETIIGKSGAKGGQARSDIVALEGARLAICAETSEMARLNEADVKRMTGGDEISARGLYASEASRFKTSWLLCVATNYMPEIKGDDDGIWRRVADIEFPRNFDTDPKVKKDPLLEEKIGKELPGVLNWLIAGLHDYQANGLQIPKKVELSVKEYREESDDVARWAGCRLVKDDGSRVFMSEAYESFKQMMKSEGQQQVISQAGFSRRIKKHFANRATSDNLPAVYKTKGFLAVRGYRLATADDFEENDPFA